MSDAPLFKVVLVSAGLCLADTVSAALIDRGGGFIYDDVLNVTWFQETDIGRPLGSDYLDSKALVESMSVFDPIRQTWWNDWRLPRINGPVNGVSYDFNQLNTFGHDLGWNTSAPGTAFAGTTVNELAHLYYSTLGNLGCYAPGSPTGGVSCTQQGSGLVNTGPLHLIKSNYAMDAPAELINPGSAIYFGMSERADGITFRGSPNYNDPVIPHRGVIAVRDGDVGAGGGDAGPSGPIPRPPGGQFPAPPTIGANTPAGGYFDPDVAIGYDYVVSDPAVRFTKVQIPYMYGNGIFDLFLWDETLGEYVDSGFDVSRNEIFDFKAKLGLPTGLTRFSMRGIEVEAAVDPNDPLGFVTGLWFEGQEGHTFTMTPVVVTVPVPEPSVWALCMTGLVLLTLAVQNATRRPTI